MREEREGWVSTTKVAAAHRNHDTRTNTTPARDIHRVAQSPPPHTITLNIHKNAWEDVQGRPTTVQCGALKILRGRVVAWVWHKPPASLSAAEGGPPRHTGSCSGPLTLRRDQYGPAPYGDAVRGPVEPRQGHKTGPG